MTTTMQRSEDGAAAAEGDERLRSLLASPERLAAVRASGLLDSEPEPAFDGLTRLAVRLLRVPASFVSIVDEQRDFYKSQCGFGEPLAGARELRGRTFCHHALLADGPLVIEDTHASPRWQAVPTVHSLGVRAYVGMPLQLDGQRIGSFCVIDLQPRRWSDEELQTLSELATSAQRELSLRMALARARDQALGARALARTREQVVAVIAHDLRSALQVLQMSWLVADRKAPATPEVRERMARGFGAARGILDELMSDSALLAEPSLAAEPIAAPQLIDDVLAMMAPIAQRREVKLLADGLDDGRLSLEYARALRVLGLLVGDAIRRSAAGGAVRVSARRQGAEMRIVVADDGRAAAERAEDSSDAVIAIARSIVERHGGRIVEDDDAPRIGGRVSVHLPRVV